MEIYSQRINSIGKNYRHLAIEICTHVRTLNRTISEKSIIIDV